MISKRRLATSVREMFGLSVIPMATMMIVVAVVIVITVVRDIYVVLAGTF